MPGFDTLMRFGKPVKILQLFAQKLVSMQCSKKSPLKNTTKKNIVGRQTLKYKIHEKLEIEDSSSESSKKKKKTLFFFVVVCLFFG